MAHRRGQAFGLVPLPLRRTCARSLRGRQPQATIFLLPQTDAETAGNPVLNRNATWTGQGWTISLTDGAGAATSSNAVAEVYCLYP